jgi:hypothetical protein
MTWGCDKDVARNGLMGLRAAMMAVVMDALTVVRSPKPNRRYLLEGAGESWLLSYDQTTGQTLNIHVFKFTFIYLQRFSLSALRRRSFLRFHPESPDNVFTNRPHHNCNYIHLGTTV